MFFKKNFVFCQNNLGEKKKDGSRPLLTCAILSPEHEQTQIGSWGDSLNLINKFSMAKSYLKAYLKTPKPKE